MADDHYTPFKESDGNVFSMPESFSPKVMTISGMNKTIVTIHPDGRVDYTGTPDEAAKAFWDAVQTMGMKLTQCNSTEPKEPTP